MFPPMMVCSARAQIADHAAGTDDDPRTIPKFLTTRYPGSSSPESPFLRYSSHVGCSSNETFTAAILPGKRRSARNLPLLSSRRGDTFLFLALLQVLTGVLPYLACAAVARVCAARLRTDAGFYSPRVGVAVPLQRR